MPDANETVVRRFMDEVVNGGDYAAMRELLHPDYVYRSPDRELRGLGALEDLFTAYRSGLPDLATSIDDLVVSGDKVVICITLKGTHNGELMGIPATGRKLTVQGIVLSRLEDGLIVQEYEILDMLGLYRQLGIDTLPS